MEKQDIVIRYTRSAINTDDVLFLRGLSTNKLKIEVYEVLGKSFGDSAMGIMIIFAATYIFGGIFQKAGEEIYLIIKEKIKQIIDHNRNLKNLQIQYCVESSEGDIYIHINIDPQYYTIAESLLKSIPTVIDDIILRAGSRRPFNIYIKFDSTISNWAIERIFDLDMNAIDL